MIFRARKSRIANRVSRIANRVSRIANRVSRIAYRISRETRWVSVIFLRPPGLGRSPDRARCDPNCSSHVILRSEGREAAGATLSGAEGNLVFRCRMTSLQKRP